MRDKRKLGFGGRWWQAFSVGRHTGTTEKGERKTINVTPDYINKLAENYDVALHEAPACIGHPKHDAPAFGWISDVRVNNDKLELQFSDTQPEFERMVEAGLFKKRSLKLYLNPAEAPGGRTPYIRHCAFLGAEPPAIKDLENMQFKEDEGETITFDIEFSEGAATMTDAEKKAAQDEAKKSVRETVTEFLKEVFGAGKDKEAIAFSEAKAQELIDKAVAAAETKLSDQLKTANETIAKLQTQVNSQGSSTTRSSILSFCESVGAERLIPALKNMGVVEFMESLAAIPETEETKVSVISFSEEEKKNITTKMSRLEWFQNFLKALPPFVQFGEQFGSLRLRGDGSQITNPAELDTLRSEVGLKTSDEKAAAAK